MNSHLAAVLSHTILLHDLRPEHAGCAELGQLHEVVGRNAHIEFDARSSFRSIHTLVGKHGKPFSAPCKRISELLIDISTCIAEHI